MTALMLAHAPLLAAQASPVPFRSIVLDAPAGGRSTAHEWRARADSLRDVGRHRDAIAAYERALQLGVTEPQCAAFGVARSYAHLGNRTQALRWLRSAVGLGLTDRARIHSEPEFRRYRDDATFRAIVESIGLSPGSRFSVRPESTGRDAIA